MPTECERSITSPSTAAPTSSSSSLATNTTTITTDSTATSASEIKDNLTQFNEDLQMNHMMESAGDMSTSQTSTTSNGSSCNGSGVRKTSITSPDPTAYVAKARVTRPPPPPPNYNPMQFVQIKPCNLYQTAQEQLKKAEEVKKIKEIRKEEPEDWQNNLDNWKSSRRKRVEHIIDRVVEVKKLELEEHDRTRRKSKTFSEMIEERGERANARPLNKLVSLAVYAEDEANDLSDLGIGTSSASGKSSLSEDYDNNSVMSDNAAELDKAITNSNHKTTTESTTREYISSPGYETSSSTAPASSPDPCEYTYEGAIQDYKQRVSRAASGLTSVALNKLTNQQQNSKESTPERTVNKETAYPPRRGSKIEDRLMGFEVQSPSEECVEKNKVDVPKIDISKRKEMFESQQQQQQHSTQTTEPKSQLTAGQGQVPRVTLRDRFKVHPDTTETIQEQPKKDMINVKRMSGDITSIKERLQNLEQQQNLVNGANGANKTTANKLVDIPVPPLKERLSSLQNAVTKEEVRKPPVVLIDARQLEIMKSEDQKVKQTMKEETEREQQHNTVTMKSEETKCEDSEIDRDDSGIHTADDVELEERLQADIMKKEQELKLNAAIEALALEEKQLSEAANAVNQIEAEFEELTLGSVALPPLASSNASSATPITNDHMEYSVSSTNNSSLTQPPPPPSSTSSDSSSNIGSVSGNNEVKGVDCTKVTSNLRRKPTNEMVHAKNLLKIFKETFQNDIDLDEDEVNEEHEIKDIKEQDKELKKLEENAKSLNIKTQVFQNSNTTSGSPKSPTGNATQTLNSPPSLPPKPTTPQTPTTPSLVGNHNLNSPCLGGSVNATPPALPPKPTTPQTPTSPSLTGTHSSPLETVTPSSPPSNIPRCMTPLGKPPMSPLAIRSTTKFVATTPPGSPSMTRKTDSQFSINGRVEIFNSKNMAAQPTTTTTNNHNNNGNIPKPTTPIMTAKKTQLPYINATNECSAATPKSSQSNNIVLPQQHQQQQQLNQQQTTKQMATTNQQPTTVIEPLSTTTIATTETVAATTQTIKQKIEQLKSMPSQQMVNEPQMMLDGETHHQQHQHHHLPNHTNDSVNHQQQQPEVVICAPPITIVNPDELPKPNTVKNLSSCFQQPNAIIPTVNSKLITPKPLPRSRIPQATPPQSPTAARRHVCYSSEQSSAKEQEQQKLTPNSPQSFSSNVEQQNKLFSNSAQSSSNSAQSSSSALEEQKKLSVISSSSTSSTSTDSTVIDANKKLSIMSNISSASSEAPPTIVKTNAQVHHEPEEVAQAAPLSPAKTLNKQATQALVDEMIKAEALIIAPIQDTKKSKEQESPSPITPSTPKIDSANIDSSSKANSAHQDSSPTTPSTPKANCLKFGEIKPYSSPLANSAHQDSSPTTPSTPSTPKANFLKFGEIKPYSSPLAPLAAQDDSPSPESPLPTPSTPKANFFKFGEIKPYQGSSIPTPSSPKPYERKTQPNTPSSPKSELFRTTTPLVVSTLYDKYLPDNVPLNNQRPLPASPKPIVTSPTIIIPADLPNLIDCPPNESSLYKLASSAPHSPSSPCSNPDKNLDIDSAICNSLLTSLAVTPDVIQLHRQTTVEEDLCQKVDKDTLPFNEPITGFIDISKSDIKRCDGGLSPSSAHKLQSPTQRQHTIEEKPFEKLDIHSLPDDKQQPITGYKCISPTEIRICDNLFSVNSGKPNSNPNSPIMEARAAHSKALIETCEKIIAEEKQASSQLKSSLPSSPRETPIMQRKSKLPKPITSCCKATESLTEADLIPNTPTSATSSSPNTPTKEDNNAVIARMHVVETQIKVTTTTPPASPKIPLKPQPSPKPAKKTKNIFDFLKKNFGGSHPEDPHTQKEPEVIAEKQPVATTPSENKVLVLSAEDLKDLDEVKYDEIHKIENSKFYLPAAQQKDEDIPPPLPKTPAPVNIEITRKIITNEILEDGKSEMDFTKEIDDLLDDELNKLNHEVEELDKLSAK